MKSDTRKITEGAMIVAMIGAILFLDRQMANILSAELSWVLSLPIIIYTVQADEKYSWMVFFSALIVSLFISPPQTIFYLFSALLLGVIYGQGVIRKWSQNKLLLWTIVCTFVSYLISMYIFAGFFGYDLIATRNEFITWLESQPIFQNLVIFFLDAHTLFHVVDVTSFLLLVVAESLCVHLLAHIIFVKLKINVEKIKIDLNFQYPKALAIGGIISILLFLSLQWFEVSETIQFVFAFFYLILFIVNLFYGMIVMRSVKGIPALIRLIILIVPIFWPLVMILGIVDGLMDGKIRKRGRYGQTGKL